MTEPVMKIDGEPTQSDIDNLKNELTKHASKIKTMADIIEHGKKYGFLIIVVGLLKCKTIIKNPQTVWNEPEYPRLYDNLIVDMETTFAKSKKEKTHSRNEKEYKKYLGDMESIRTLTLQAVEVLHGGIERGVYWL